MAQLRYQNTEGPDFRGAMQGYQLSTDALVRALSGAGGALAGLQRERTAAIDNAVMARALQQQDVGQYTNSLQDGSLLAGVRPNQISTATLAALDARRGTLQANETNRQTFDQNAYTYGRGRDMDARMDAANPAIAALAQAATRGDTAAIRNIQEENAAALGNLTGQQSLDLASTQQRLLSGELGQRRGEFGLRVDQRNDNQDQAAIALAQQVLRSSGSAEDARAMLESTDTNPQVRARALGMLEGRFGQVYGNITAPSAGPSGGGGAPSGQGAAGTRNGNVYDTAFEFKATPQPITQMPISSVLAYQDQMRSTQGHSPLGAFQINKQTLEDYGPRVLGANWRDQKFDAEAQNKIGEAIFNDRKGRDLTQTWAALTDKTPGAYKDKSWEEVRKEISQAEVGRSVSQRQTAQADAAQLSTGFRQMQNLSQGITADLPQTLADNRDVISVAQELLDGPLKGADRGTVVGQLNRIIEQTGGNAATAGAVLRRNTDGASTNILSRIANGVSEFVAGPSSTSPRLGNGLQINGDGVAADIKQLKSGGAQRQVLAAQNLARVGAQIQGARERATEAQQQLAQAMQRAQTQPLFRQQLPRYQQRAQLAQAALDRALQGQAGDENFNPVYTQTQKPVTGSAEDVERGRTVPNLENMTTMEQTLYQNGLLPDYYFRR